MSDKAKPNEGLELVRQRTEESKKRGEINQDGAVEIGGTLWAEEITLSEEELAALDRIEQQ